MIARWGSNLLIFLIIAYGYVSQYAFFPNITPYVFITAVVLLGLHYILALRIRKSQVIKYCMFLILALFITYVSKAPHFVFAIIIAISFLVDKKSNASIVRTYFWTSLIFFLITIILYATGVLPDNVIYRATETGWVVRSNLGFDNPNTAMIFALPMFAAGYYLYGKRLGYWLLSLPALALLYFATDCRTGAACILFFFIAALLFSHRKKVSTFLSYIFATLFFLLSALSIALATSSLSGLTAGINELLSNRLYLWSYYIDNHLTTTLLGGEKVPGYVLDNVYIFILVKMGIFAFMLYGLVYFVGTRRLKSDRRMLIVVAGYLVYGILETNVILTSINFIFPIIVKSIIEKWTVNNSVVTGDGEQKL